jgi:hypothetical protein
VKGITSEIARQEEFAKKLDSKPERSASDNQQLEEARAKVRELKAGLPEEEKKRDDLRQTADETRKEERANIEKANIKAAATSKQYVAGRELRKLRTGQKINSVRKAEAEEEQRKKDKADHETASQKQREIDAGFSADKVVSQAVPIAGRRMGGKAVEALGTLRKKFEDGASMEELDELLRDLLVLARKGGSLGPDGKVLETLQREVRQLKTDLSKQKDVNHS